MKLLCFVLIPSGKQASAIYHAIIAPAIADAGLDLLGEEEMSGGIINRAAFERLILCEYAVVDLTAASANVFYELGVRDTVRPLSTVLLFAQSDRLSFDASPLEAMPYSVSTDGSPANAESDRQALAERLREARRRATGNAAKESPVYRLVEHHLDVSHTKTDLFRERVRCSDELKERLAQARNEGLAALNRFEEEFSPVADLESGVVVDLLLSYRSLSAWQSMIELVNKMSRPLAETALAQEQLALALNRAGHSEAAEEVLKNLLARRGPSGETYGILGRVYKDRWEAALARGDKGRAGAALNDAIEAYLRGFEADWRDAYPGVNAITLMEIKNPPDSRREQLIPVVAYAVERRIASGKPDYWDYATRLELAILEKNEEKAVDAITHTLASARESWEPETTARNLRLIREARERRQEELSWANEIERELLEKSALRDRL
ncbi:MAG TPA: TRAFs-binding domain-containing protein [Blastocatellia bacterium]|jgi:hypothetical protein